MAAVSRLQIISGGWKMKASVTEDHLISPATSASGTIVQTAGLFENFPARRQFLKRPASEGSLCRTTFEEKALPRPDIGFKFSVDGEERLSLPEGQSLKDRFIQTMEFFEDEDCFHEISSQARDGSWSFKMILGTPSVTRSNRKNISIYVNGRKISEYSLLQAIEYGGQGFFPNGTHPVAAIFITMDPSLVDFNIHPAKREARFKDISGLHHGISTATRDFYKQFTVKEMYASDAEFQQEFPDASTFAASPAQGEHTVGYQESHVPSSVSYSSVHRDRRASFFPKSGQASYSTPTFKSSVATDYAKRIADLASDESDGTDSTTSYASDEKSNSGLKPARPNYIPSEHDNPETGFHFVGQTLGTFLIAEKNDTLYIIDQHAAHERYLYNQIMEKAGEKQALLIPYTVQTTSTADDKYLEEIQDTLEEAGFTGKNCGNGKWEFTTVPVRWKGTEADLARDLLDRRIQPHDIINAVAASTACRRAVMDGDVLDDDMASWLCEEALKLPDPHCPHGRPVFTTITRRQLFTLVKRIQP
jgi:DNA mismatch repair protein MutL